MTLEIVSSEFIRTAFASANFKLLFSGRNTHEPALAFIGELIPFTQNESLISDLVKSGLPEEYSGDTLREVPSMIAWWKDRVASPAKGEEAKPEKLSAASNMLQIVDSHGGISLSNDGFGRAFITVQDDKGTRTLALTSGAAQHLLKHRYYIANDKPITTNAFKEVLDTLIARALYEGETRKVFLRLARVEGLIVFYLADDSGTQVMIDKAGWSLTREPVAAFVKSSSMAAMPLPKLGNGSSLLAFQNLLGLSNEHFYRVVAFLISSLRPEGPYLVLMLEGEQGSGKSMLSECIKKIVDWGQARNVRLPDSARDLMIQAKDSHLLVFDNVSGMNQDMSDALCTLATGGGLATRRLYTDDELQIFDEARPFIINGIYGLSYRPDLLERSLSLRLPSMPKDQRQTEGDLRKKFYALLPELLGTLFSIMSCAMRRIDEVEPPKDFRMADAAHWLLAAEPATELPEGALLRALSSSQRHIILEMISTDSLAIALAKVAEKGPFEGTLGLLYQRLEEFRPKYDRFFPNSSSQLSKALARNKPAMAVAGIMVEIGPKVRKGKMVKLWLEEGSHAEEMSSEGIGWNFGIEF